MALTHTADIPGAPPGLMVVTTGEGEGVAPRPLTSAGGCAIAVTRAWAVVIVKI